MTVPVTTIAKDQASDVAHVPSYPLFSPARPPTDSVMPSALSSPIRRPRALQCTLVDCVWPPLVPGFRAVPLSRAIALAVVAYQTSVLCACASGCAS